MTRQKASKEAYIALILAAFAILLTAGLYLKSTKTFTKKEVTAALQQNRVVLTAQSCRQRNDERRVTRQGLMQELQDLKRVPDAALEQFGFTRQEALDRKREQIRKVAPLNCKRLVRQVRSTKAISSTGGGSGSLQGIRRTQTQRGAETPSKPRERQTDSPGAPGTGSPPEPGPTRPGPPPGDIEPPDDGDGGGGGDGGSGGSVNPPVVDVPDTIKKIDPRLCTIQVPLGPPIVRIC